MPDRSIHLLRLVVFAAGTLLWLVANAAASPEASESQSADPWTRSAPALVGETVGASAPLADGHTRGAVPAVVTRVGFEASAGEVRVDRVVIEADSVLRYEVSEPNPETVVVRLPASVIDSRVAGRIETPNGGSVRLVTAFQQPEVTPEEARVVVQRVAGSTLLVSREGTTLVLDFAPASGTAAAARPEKADLQDAARALAREADSPLSLDPKSLAEPPDVRRAGSELDAAWSEAGNQPFESSAGRASRRAEEPRSAADLLQADVAAEEKIYRGRRISLDFKDVPVSDVLRLIAEVSNLNVVAGDEVKGKVTIRMMDVPWDQALDVVLMTKGLGFQRVGNVIRIAPSDVLKSEAELRLQERRNREKFEDLIVVIHAVNYADVAEAAALVERLLTERGTVNWDERTSQLIIKDIPSVVKEALHLVDAIDTQTPQVLIEAKIVEANLDFSRELGSEWSIGTQQYADGFTQTGVNRGLGGDAFRFYGDNGVSFANPINGTATATAALSAFLLDENLNLDVQLKAREAAGETKVVSSPRIVTMDNRKAVIEQGVSIPFQTFENGDAKLEFVDAVLSLTVTPHITADDSIIMELLLTRNAPIDTPNSTGSPSIAKNVAQTETLVRDGQTLVLGGIYTVQKSDTKTAVPYLSRIPILGGAFQSKNVRDDRKELLMFVTPRIIRNPSEG